MNRTGASRQGHAGAVLGRADHGAGTASIARLAPSVPRVLRPRWHLWLLAVLPNAGWSAVAGLPTPPTPMAVPDAWFAFHDDLFGDAILNTDDYRTGGISGGLRYRHWLLGVDGSALTNRDGIDESPSAASGLPPSRIDQLTATLGYALIDRQPDMEQPLSGMLVVGGGVRVTARLHGQEIQNGIHRLSGFAPLVEPYDKVHAADGLGFIQGRVMDAPIALPGALPGRLGVQLQGDALAAAGRQEQCSGELDVVALGDQGTAWAGGQYRQQGDHVPSPTVGLVAHHEKGWWLVAGIGRSPGVYLTAGIDPATRAVDGALGMQIVLDEGPSAPTASAPLATRQDVARLDEELRFLPGSGSLGAQVRWEPAAWHVDDLPWRNQVMIDYHFGADSATRPAPGNRIDADQVVIGYAPTIIRPLPWHLVGEGTLSLAGGVRVERVETLAAGATYPQATGAAPVVQGGASVRIGCDLDGDPRRLINQLRLGVGVIAWAPFWHGEDGNGTSSLRYLAPGIAPVLSLGLVVHW
jgi:hypothetical protein